MMNQIMDLKAQVKRLRIVAAVTFVTMILFLSVTTLALWAVKYGVVPCSNNYWLSITIVSAVMCTGLYFMIGIGLLGYISELKKRIREGS